jgi:hypothetical protein
MDSKFEFRFPLLLNIIYVNCYKTVTPRIHINHTRVSSDVAMILRLVTYQRTFYINIAGVFKPHIHIIFTLLSGGQSV